MSPEELATIGNLAFGQLWQTSLKRRMKVHAQTIAYWMKSGTPWWRDLAVIAVCQQEIKGNYKRVNRLARHLKHAIQVAAIRAAERKARPRRKPRIHHKRLEKLVDAFDAVPPSRRRQGRLYPTPGRLKGEADPCGADRSTR